MSLSGDPGAAAVGGLVDHLFRHTAGRIIASLTRFLGPARIDLAEEAVQDALVRALETWPFRGVPDDPAAWIARVARNRALDLLRRESHFNERIAPFLELPASTARPEPGSTDPLLDDELCMVLMCCDPSIPRDARVAITLKTVGGFSVREIARACLAREDAVAQRLVRAKRSLRESGVSFRPPGSVELARRLDSALDALYLMFNEGYEAAGGDALVRFELCAEAIRLAGLLARYPATARPEVHALLALMLFQASRLEARTDDRGALLLLSEQDRGRWDRAAISRAMRHLDAATSGSRVTRYHLEAGIAACHAVAPDQERTDWRRIVELYDALLDLNPSPVVALNRAVAVGMLDGPAAALALLDGLEADPTLRRYFLLPATRGDLLRRSGDREGAATCYRDALELPCSGPERAFLLRRLAECAGADAAPDAAPSAARR